MLLSAQCTYMHLNIYIVIWILSKQVNHTVLGRRSHNGCALYCAYHTKLHLESKWWKLHAIQTRVFCRMYSFYIYEIGSDLLYKSQIWHLKKEPSCLSQMKKKRKRRHETSISLHHQVWLLDDSECLLLGIIMWWKII